MDLRMDRIVAALEVRFMNQMPLSLSLAVLAFMMTVIWGGPLLRILRHFKVGKVIRVEEPGHHAVKMGTPTMGGVMFIAPVVLLTLLLNASSIFGVAGIGRSILLPLVVLLAFAILGAVDDWEGIRGPRRGDGMRSRTKFVIQVVLALATAYALKYLLQVPDLYLPGYPIEIKLGLWYVPIAAFIIVSMSNAVNFTDGLDGLAGLIAATAFVAYGAIALMQGQTYVARFCFIMVGALFGFLVVQRASRASFHGRYRLTCAGSDPCNHCIDDRAMGCPSSHCHHPRQRNRQ